MIRARNRGWQKLMPLLMVCDDVGDGPQCSEPHGQPCAAVEHAGQRGDDAAAMPCEEDDVSAQVAAPEQQQPVPEVGESDAMPRSYAKEAAARSHGAGPAMADVYVSGASAPREGECAPPASSVVNDEDCTHVATESGDTAVTDDPGMESLHHALPTTTDNVAADDEACVQPPVGNSEDRVSTPGKEGEIPGETERTGVDAEDVGCGDDGGGNSSTIATQMRRKPQSRKPVAIHGSPFTDPTHPSSARKSKKERNEGVTGGDEARAMDDPGERSVDPPVLDVQSLSVEGSSIGTSVKELSKIKLMRQVFINFSCKLFDAYVLEMYDSWFRIMQVLAGYISAPFSATEMELVTKVRTRFKGVRTNARQW